MSDADDVMVQPIRTFMEGAEVVQPSTKPYPVSRSRAVELRSNGLVEWEPEEAPATEPAPPTGGTAPAEPDPDPAPEAPKPRGRRAS